MIEALVRAWKGTNKNGVEAIERELNRYYSDFPTMKNFIRPTPCYNRLLTSYEPNAAQIVKYWGNEFLTEKTSDSELLTLIKNDLVPKLVRWNGARLDLAQALVPAVHAEYLGVMKKYHCHDDFYAVSKLLTTKSKRGNKAGRNGPTTSSASFLAERNAVDRALQMVTQNLKEAGLCWNCFLEEHATRDCPKLSDAETNLAYYIMPDYKETTKRGRSAHQYRLAKLWNNSPSASTLNLTCETD